MGLLFALGFSFIYLIKACFADNTPWFDGAAYFFLMLALFSNKPVITGLSVFLAAFIDERALIASGLVFIWWKIAKLKGRTISFKYIIKPDIHFVFIVLAWVSYFLVRFILIHHYGLSQIKIKMADVINYMKDNVNHFAFLILTGLKWFNIFILLGIILMIRLKYYYVLILYVLCTLLILLTAFMIHDVTRTVSYAFPAIFIALYLFVREGDSLKNLRYLTLTIVILCFLMASYSMPPL
jgi:hypothetical protein